MLKFICPSCHTENLLNEGVNRCLCAGCSLVHRITPELSLNDEQLGLRGAFETSYFRGNFEEALSYAEKYDDLVETIPSHYIKECLQALVLGDVSPTDALVEQFIMLGFVAHKRMMAWKVIDNWLKTQSANKYYSQWLLALSNFHFKHKAIFDETQYDSSARVELNRVLTPDITYGLVGSIGNKLTKLQRNVKDSLLSQLLATQLS